MRMLQGGELTLERMRVGAQHRISAGVLATVRLEEYRDALVDGLVYQLSAEVLAERVLDTDQTVPWRGEARVPVPGHSTRFTLAPFGLAAILGALAPLGLAFFIAAVLVLVLAVVIHAANPPVPPTTTMVPVCGDVTVPATYWRKFPEATIPYPDSLGRFVRFATLSEPSFRAPFEDDA